MSAQDASQNNEAEQGKILVGTFSFNTSDKDLKAIQDKIGNVLEAQIILRGSEALGYGHVFFNSNGEQVDGEHITGNARLRGAGRTRGRGRAARGRGGARGGRRSADDVDENGTTTVKNVVEGIEKDNNVHIDQDAVNAKSELSKEVSEKVDTVPATGGRGRGRGARGAARGARGGAARVKKPRGEPSQTLVFLRNMPYSYTQSDVEAMLKEASLSYSSISIPKWTYGPHKGAGKGFAFITTSNQEEQNKVIEALNGKDITVEATGPAAGGAQTEGGEEGQAPQSREKHLKLQARQGYENEQNDKEEDGAAANEDSGTAEVDESKTGEAIAA